MHPKKMLRTHQNSSTLLVWIVGTTIRIKSRPAVLFKQKFRLGHQENYLLPLSKKNLFWIKVSKRRCYFNLKTEAMVAADPSRSFDTVVY